MFINIALLGSYFLCRDDDAMSTVSSLTSLSSEAEDGGAPAPVVPVVNRYREELRVAQVSCSRFLFTETAAQHVRLASV
jgi:hypothetical protein